MIVLVSGATATLRRLKDPRFGVLIVPDARNRPDRLPLRPGAWAMDNGAYSGFDAGAFVAMLERFHPYAGCRFVSAPDVVGSADKTLALWPFWSRLIRGVGFPVAFVAQDGITPAVIPWDELATVFIGGTTAWKEGAGAVAVMAEARSRHVPIHVGRVSTWGRLRYMRRHGATSVDTSGLSKYPDVMALKFQRYLSQLEDQPELELL